MLLTETSVPLVAGSDAAALPYFGTDAPRGSRAPPVALLSHLQRHEVGCKAQQPDAHTHVFGCWGRPATHWCQAASPRPWAHSPHLCPQTAGKPSPSNNSLPSLLSPFFFFLFFFCSPYLSWGLYCGRARPAPDALPSSRPPPPETLRPSVGAVSWKAGQGGDPESLGPAEQGGLTRSTPPFPPRTMGAPTARPEPAPQHRGEPPARFKSRAGRSPPDTGVWFKDVSRETQINNFSRRKWTRAQSWQGLQTLKMCTDGRKSTSK